MVASPAPKQYPYGPVSVDADEIIAFCAGINEDAAVHTDPSRDDFCAPPMFCARVVIPCTGAPLFDPSLGLDVHRVVHAGIEIEFGVAVRPGDSLSAESSLLGIDEKPTGKLLRIAFSVARGDSAAVVSGETRYFIRGPKREIASGGGGARPKAAPRGLPEGEPACEEEVPTRPDQTLLYAEGSGDKFPIHTDDAFARSVGLPGMIMHGMCSLAMSARAVAAATGGGDYRRLACRFGSIALPGRPLAVRAVRGEGGILCFEARDPDGKPVITAGELSLG